MPRATEFQVASECAKCTEPVVRDALACDFCGYPVRPHKPVGQRLAEVASLAAALALVIAVCRLLGNLLDV